MVPRFNRFLAEISVRNPRSLTLPNVATLLCGCGFWNLGETLQRLFALLVLVHWIIMFLAKVYSL